MRSRLYATAENGKHSGVVLGEPLHSHRADGSGPHFGDEPAIHHGDGFARGRAEDGDDALMGWEGRAGILRKERDELRTEDAAIDCGHDPEETMIRSDRQNASYWMHNLARGEVRKCPLHGRNQGLVAQYLADCWFVKVRNCRVRGERAV